MRFGRLFYYSGLLASDCKLPTFLVVFQSSVKVYKARFVKPRSEGLSLIGSSLQDFDLRHLPNPFRTTATPCQKM